MKAAMLVSLVVALAGLMGGCPLPGVTAPDTTEQGLVPGVYTGVVTANQTVQGAVEEQNSLQIDDTIIVDQEGSIVRNGTPHTLGQVWRANTDGAITTYTVNDIREVENQLSISFRQDTLLGPDQVFLTGFRRDTFTQVDENTIRFDQTSVISRNSLVVSSSAEGILTR